MGKLFIRNIKKGFATNSSSYHSTLILTEEEYEKWTNNEITIEDYYGDEISYEDFDENYETDVTRYTSPSGDKIVVICQHGNNY